MKVTVTAARPAAAPTAAPCPLAAASRYRNGSPVIGCSKPNSAAWKRLPLGAAGVRLGRAEKRLMVNLLAADRMARLGQVNANLVRPPGLQPAFQSAYIR